MNKRLRGFSLIELVITVAVIGIVASIAVPAYSGYVTRSRQTAAQQFIMDVANAQESYRADALRYSDKLDATGLNLTPAAEPARYYKFELSNVTPTTYTITATPQNGQAGPVLTLDQAGARTGW